MKSHQERVLTERNELSEKLTKLEAFIFHGQIFSSIPPDEQKRLLKQYFFMEAYLEVLEDRIANF